MYCITKCIVRGNQVHVKNADLRHLYCTVVMYRRKCASPVHNVLTIAKGINIKQNELSSHNSDNTIPLHYLMQSLKNPFPNINLKYIYQIKNLKA